MSSAPFDVVPVVERLATLVPTLQQVRGSADYAAVSSKGLREFRPPEAFVIAPRERGKPSPGNSRQSAFVQFAVVTAVRNVRYQRGMPALQDAAPLIGEIRDQLMGWIPPVPGGRGCAWVEGHIVDYDAGVLLWSDLFQTQHFIGRNS